MKNKSILEREIEHLKSDGSRKTPIPGWPSQEKIDKAYEISAKFNKKLSEDNSVVDLVHLVPYIRQHLKRMGGLSGVIEYGSPEHFHQGEYIVQNNYRFLGKNVKGSIKLEKEEFSDSRSLVFQDFASYFPDNTVQDLGEGKIILR